MAEQSKNKWKSQYVQKQFKNKHKNNTGRHRRNDRNDHYKQQRDFHKLISEQTSSLPISYRNNEMNVTPNYKKQYDTRLITLDRLCKMLEDKDESLSSTQAFKPKTEEILVIQSNIRDINGLCEHEAEYNEINMYPDYNELAVTCNLYKLLTKYMPSIAMDILFNILIPFIGYKYINFAFKLIRSVKIKTNKCKENKLLNRKEMNVDIEHHNLATPSTKLIKRRISNMYQLNDTHKIVLFGFKSKYGKGRTNACCFIYNHFKYRQKHDYKYSLLRDKLTEKNWRGSRTSRKQWKNIRKQAKCRYNTKYWPYRIRYIPRRTGVRITTRDLGSLGSTEPIKDRKCKKRFR